TGNNGTDNTSHTSTGGGSSIGGTGTVSSDEHHSSDEPQSYRDKHRYDKHELVNGKAKGKSEDKKDNHPKKKKKQKPKIVNHELELVSEHPDYFIDPVKTVEYDYDGVGNRKRMVADGKITEYAYDGANRLQSAGDESYIYDQSGNLQERSGGSQGTVQYAYTGDNKLKSVNYEDGSKVEYAYDALRRKVSRTQSYFDPDKIAA
ncbi:RHS repeat domain-containing protein, partial [Paenibacillus alginolyticus]